MRTVPATAPVASTTVSRFPVRVTIRLPSVFTMSGSSTPFSWLFVPEKSGVVPAPPEVPWLGLAGVAALAESSRAIAVAPVPARGIGPPP